MSLPLRLKTAILLTVFPQLLPTYRLLLSNFQYLFEISQCLELVRTAASVYPPANYLPVISEANGSKRKTENKKSRDCKKRLD